MPFSRQFITCPLPKIALTGGIATGKTTVSRMLEKRGAYIIDADIIARKILEPGTKCWNKLVKILDPSFFDSEGNLKRGKLRKAIAQNPDLRKTVNSITHPEIVKTMERLWFEQTRLNPKTVKIFDIPLLFEVNLHNFFSFIILVYVPPKVQIERLAKRDNITIDEAVQALSMQLPIEEKRSKSHWIIDNSSTLEDTEAQVDKLWHHLVVIPSGRVKNFEKEWPMGKKLD